MTTLPPTERNYCGPKTGSNDETTTQRVVKTEKGEKYHLENHLIESPSCNPNREIDGEFKSRDKAEDEGLESCHSCFPGEGE